MRLSRSYIHKWDKKKKQSEIIDTIFNIELFFFIFKIFYFAVFDSPMLNIKWEKCHRNSEKITEKYNFIIDRITTHSS